MFHRQQIREELDRHAIGQQRCPPDFLTEQFWGAALREEHGNWAPTALLVGLTGTCIQAWALECQFAEEGSQADLVVPLTGQGLLAVRTLALLLHILLDLLCRHDVLDAGQ